MIQGVQALVNGSGVEKVAEYVEKGLAGAFTAAADFILGFFHLDAIPKAIRQVSDKWVDIVPRKLAELLGRLKGALLEQLQKLWGGYWGRAEWTAGNEKHKIWVDFRSGKVSMASRAQEPSVYVKDLRRRAAKNEKATTAAGKAADALAVVEKAAGEIQSATARAANKGASDSERATAVNAARSASAKAQESLREFAKDAGEAEKALGSSCSLGTRQPEKQAGCWRKGTLCRGGDGEARAIEEQRLGRRVGTLPQAEHARAMAPRLEIDPALWREVFLVQDNVDNGGVVSMGLLRPLAWLEQHGVELGAWVALDLPELGVHGEALVTAVQPCPEIEEGEGRLVTGTFRRSKALVMELKVAGESEVLGVTGNHLVWSEDRQDWLAVKYLDIGERLRAWDGSTPEVESLTACSEPDLVYNIEVGGDHCYRVGQQGLLVHNASAGRVTESNRVADYAAAPVNCVVTDPTVIAQVIGSGGLNATGTHTTILGGIFQFILRGRGAGFLGVTRDAGTRRNLAIMRIQNASTTDVIIVAVDLSLVPAVSIYTPDTPVGTPPQPLFDALLAQYPTSPRLAPTLPVLRNEGWTAIDGKVPPAAIVKLLRTTKSVATATIDPLLVQLFS